LVDLEVNFVNNEDLKYFDKEKLILSYHNFKEVPDLFFIAEKITRLSPYVCKMACMANSYSDVNLMKTALRIFLKKYLTQQRIIIPM
jgi:3-dehydroquinate dehydratase